MHTPPRILVVDDQPQNVDILKDRLGGHGYELRTATTGESALAIATEWQPDLILLDVIMPGIDGIEVCRRLKQDLSLPFMPVIMITAKSETQDIVTGFEAGADEYLTKPVDQEALLARVKSMLRLKSFHDRARDQATQIEAQAVELERWNETLERRLQEQMTDFERMGLLKRFVSPQLAEWVVSLGGKEPLMIHQRDVTILCCVLHGLTTFVDTTVPEAVFAVLGDYHHVLDALMAEHEGTLHQIAGDRRLVVFNAFLPCPDSVVDAVRMALLMCQQLGELREKWHESGYALDFGIGIAHGNATLGLVDLASRLDYAVMGSVQHLACRLGEAAQGGRILASQSVWEGEAERIHASPAGQLVSEGFADPIPIFEVKAKTEDLGIVE